MRLDEVLCLSISDDYGIVEALEVIKIEVLGQCMIMVRFETKIAFEIPRIARRQGAVQSDGQQCGIVLWTVKVHYRLNKSKEAAYARPYEVTDETSEMASRFCKLSRIWLARCQHSCPYLGRGVYTAAGFEKGPRYVEMCVAKFWSGRPASQSEQLLVINDRSATVSGL